jgi:glycosyltransferase involved in cell wall biosynthesis
MLGPECVANTPNPIPVVRSGIETADLRQRFGWKPSRAVVGFIGRLEQVKGPNRFLDLAARYPGDAGFVLIGPGSLERALRKRVMTEGLAERVAFMGEVPETTGYLSQFDVLALPSRHEGFPMVLLEAAACGVPLVAFDVGGVAEVLDGVLQRG